MTNLIYVHIGKTLPSYIYDSIYQTLLTNFYSTKIFVILSDPLISDFYKNISNFNINLHTNININYLNIINIIPSSILENTEFFIKYKQIIIKIPNQIKNFRDSFWISTTSRFFYMYSFQELFQIKSFFHIESDVMLYENLNKIENDFCENKMSFVQDNITRVIASIIYINNFENFKILINYIIENLIKNPSLNDMNLLGSFVNEFKNLIKLFPDTLSPNSNLIFDGAALGQFLGGIDPKNIKVPLTTSSLEDKVPLTTSSLEDKVPLTTSSLEDKVPLTTSSLEDKVLINNYLLEINNPTIGFINETARIKADKLILFRKNIVYDNLNSNIDLIYLLENKQNTQGTLTTTRCVNLHCHSKQLYQFSSIFSIKYNDIITGDRILSLCDFILSTPEIFNFHKNIDNFININNIIIVEDFKNINIKKLNQIFLEKIRKNNLIKLFIYTHILDNFIKYILNNEQLDNNLKFQIYLHNSDHSLNDNHENFINNNKIIKIYAQNINLTELNVKVNLLPIGLANSMWNHGDIISLYKTMAKNYILNKTKNVYININSSTYKYREIFLNEIINSFINSFTNKIVISKNKPFKEYLEELSQHYFCLCIRGNGIQCHRDYESLYLGVIPVLINNKHTNINSYISYLKELNLPFYEITENNTSKLIEKYFNPNQPFFTKELYKKILKNKPILLNKSLKLTTYLD